MAGLLVELEQERKNIKTDSYRMSIGEIINLFKEGDMKLDPAFQRLFRWTNEQKSKFIESILLGIPIPEIFVSQDTEGKWTIVDGVQRISTILQLRGVLPNKDPLKMTSTKYLPALENLTWADLPSEVQRIFKRAKLGINIILTENSIQAQYELFQRLNTGGLHLEPQEIRNCLIIMIKEEFYNKINALKDHTSFKNTLQLTEKKYEEEYHMELILRYLIAVYNNVDYQSYTMSSIHLREFLDKETIALIENDDFNLDAAIEKFKEVFDWLDDKLGDTAFKRYDSAKDQFSGAFSNAAFEAITTGVTINFDKLKASESDFKSKVKGMLRSNTFLENIQHGVKSQKRFKNLTEYSKVYFENE